MFELNVTITDAFTGRVGYVTIKGDIGMTIEKYFEICQQLHPDAFINFYWDKNFIFGQPFNMVQDEKLVDAGIISFDKYMNKWYQISNL